MTKYRAERDELLIDKIGKLLAKAASTKIEAERDLFNAKAMQLIEDNNLSMAAIEIGGNSAKMARRTDEKMKGGLYQWQRELWQAVADLNFCMHFQLYTFDPNKISKYWAKQYGGVAHVPDYKKGGYYFQRRLVGRVVNVQATRVMAEYLEQAIERALADELHNREDHLFSEWSNGFRSGAADEVIYKLVDRRNKVLNDEKVKERQKEAELRAKGAEGFSTDKALTLAGVKEAEEAGNYDHIHGEGAYARKLAARAAHAARIAKQEQEYAEWAKANPEEARKQEEEAEKRWRRYGHIPWNYGIGKNKYDKGGYNSGSKAGRNIGIDQQMDKGTKGLLK